MIELLYFAWVRERIGLDGERVALPEDIDTVGELLDWLERRGDGYAAALGERERLRRHDLDDRCFRADQAVR